MKRCPSFSQRLNELGRNFTFIGVNHIDGEVRSFIDPLGCEYSHDQGHDDRDNDQSNPVPSRLEKNSQINLGNVQQFSHGRT